jgi:hypothetical protein
LALAPAGPAPAQTDQPVRNAFIPMGQRLNSAQVRDELSRRLSLNPVNEAALWNTGYDFFRNYPRNQDTAQAIKDGFLQALRRNTDPGRRRILLKAAVYWEKIHDYGIINVPVGENPNSRHKIYYGDTSKAGTLALRTSGSRHPGFTGYDWPGRFINKRPPYQGRPDNPYPGRYYPGMYPP